MAAESVRTYLELIAGVGTMTRKRAQAIATSLVSSGGGHRGAGRRARRRPRQHQPRQPRGGRGSGPPGGRTRAWADSASRPPRRSARSPPGWLRSRARPAPPADPGHARPPPRSRPTVPAPGTTAPTVKAPTATTGTKKPAAQKAPARASAKNPRRRTPRRRRPREEAHREEAHGHGRRGRRRIRPVSEPSGGATRSEPSPAGAVATAPSDALATPPEDLAGRVRLLEAVETELRERLGRLELR